jgi:tetratricopeptide (TPR) repeat protein
LADLEPQLRDYVQEKVAWTKKDPRSADRQATLGLVYAANALWAEARLAFSNVVELSPKEPLGRLYLAVSTEELGDLPQASKQLQVLTARFPSFAPGFYRLGEVSLRLGSVDDAERAFNKLTVLAPTEWRGYAGLGDAKLCQGQNAQAAALLEKAIAIDPKAKNAHYLLGQAYRNLGRIEDATVELALGLNHASFPMPDGWSRLVPQHMKLLPDQFEMADDLGTTGRAPEAVKLLEDALVYHPDHVGLLNNLAIAFNRAGDPKKARVVLNRLLKLNDRYLPAYITLSYSCQALGQYDAALAAAGRALALAPKTAQAHLAKANAFLGMERDKDALAELEAAFADDPKNAEIQMEMGDVCWRNLRAPDEAFKHYVAATNLDLALAPVYVRLGDFYLTRGNSNAVQSVIQKLRRVAPDIPELPVLEQRWAALCRAKPKSGG